MVWGAEIYSVPLYKEDRAPVKVIVLGQDGIMEPMSQVDMGMEARLFCVWWKGISHPVGRWTYKREFTLTIYSPELRLPRAIYGCSLLSWGPGY